MFQTRDKPFLKGHFIFKRYLFEIAGKCSSSTTEINVAFCGDCFELRIDTHLLVYSVGVYGSGMVRVAPNAVFSPLIHMCMRYNIGLAVHVFVQ